MQELHKSHRRERRLTIPQLMEYFQGDFDNYDQVIEDRRRNLKPGKSGGHEHIHCSLRRLQVPTYLHDLGQQAILARYYFDGNPASIFRCRLYTFEDSFDEEHKGDIRMKLHKLHPEEDERVKALSKDGYCFDDRKFKLDNAKESSYIDNCDVIWWKKESALRAEMLNGGAKIRSEIMGKDIFIKDDLKLTKNELWVNDRGFDMEGNYIYGNQRGVAYKLRRVLPSNSLSWTLGGEYCTESLYSRKISLRDGFEGES